eukprot:gene17883-22820_t
MPARRHHLQLRPIPHSPAMRPLPAKLPARQRRREVAGREELTTGETGALTPAEDGSRLTLRLVGGERYRNLRLMIQELLELCLMIVGWIMRLAPLGIAALLLQLVASQNTALLGSLLHFIVVIIGSTLFHGAIVLPLLLYAVTRMSPLRFWRGAREALITAFATSSSSATLPI